MITQNGNRKGKSCLLLCLTEQYWVLPYSLHIQCSSMESKTSHAMKMTARRLTAQEVEIARQLFLLMSEVFAEPHGQLTDAYLQRLLVSESFWAVAAFSGSELLGGLTAHTLPMTRDES